MRNDSRKNAFWLGAVLAGLALAVAACGKDAGEPTPADPKQPQTTTSADKEAPKPTRSEPAPAGDTGLQTVLATYEQVWQSLAKDDIQAAQQTAGALKDAAAAAIAKAPADLKPLLERVQTAAAALAAAPADDDQAVRKAFGEVSKPVVEILAAAPDAREGWHVFECPMAQGYKKWAQPSAELSNPYMGTKMPTCGSESDWTAGG